MLSCEIAQSLFLCDLAHRNNFCAITHGMARFDCQLCNMVCHMLVREGKSKSHCRKHKSYLCSGGSYLQTLNAS